jgi:ABC-type glycerol-3-phosphate transport system substrate-binding protein
MGNGPWAIGAAIGALLLILAFAGCAPTQKHDSVTVTVPLPGVEYSEPNFFPTPLGPR